MEAKKTKAKRPKPPEELDGESLLEWDRICDELEQLGTLDGIDRAIMTLHCQTWATYQSMVKAVNKYGAVIKWPNGIPGPGPFYKVMRETAALLRGTLSDMGLTPNSRGFKVEKTEAEDLDF